MHTGGRRAMRVPELPPELDGRGERRGYSGSDSDYSGYSRADERRSYSGSDSGYGGYSRADERRGYSGSDSDYSGYSRADERRGYSGSDSGYGGYSRADERRGYSGSDSGYGGYSRADERRGYSGSDSGYGGPDGDGRDFADDWQDFGSAPAPRRPRRPGAEASAGRALKRAARRAGERMSRALSGARRERESGGRESGARESGERGEAVFGGREHDNIHAADARPNVGRAPIIAMILVAALLIVCVPLLLEQWNRRAALGGAPGAQRADPPAVITAQPGAVIPTATPAPTPEPEQLTPAPEATASGLIVSGYTGRALDRNRPAVALTFDDGPSEQTGRILDALEANGALGTFFLIGERVAGGEYASVLARQRDMGCLVGTHLYSHTRLSELTLDEIISELSQCSAAHEAAGLSAPALVRAPFGQASEEALSALGLPAIGWSLNSNDWQTQDADRIFNEVMNSVQDGDIVLFHDLKGFTAEAIERLAPALVERGYQLVTVQELFELKGLALEPGRLYSERAVATAAPEAAAQPSAAAQ